MNKETEKNLDYLYRRRERLDHDRFELSNSLDKYLFVAATGALALIIGFTGALDGGAEHKELLLISIILLFSCVIGTLLSIQLSIKAYKKQVTITDQEIRVQTGESNEICRENHWNAAVRHSSEMSEVLFVSGALTATIFYYLNIQ